ncbi:MAG: protein kinase [bacterium]|nr:protein kinase [bacterium]
MSTYRPKKIGPYRVSRRLGAGGMGEVFLAYDPRLDRRVAIKRIRPEAGLGDERRKRFHREARLAAGLNHPAIVQIFDLLTEVGVDHIVMEYVPGTSLRQILEEDGPLPAGEGLAIARNLAEGLAYAHRQGVVHRDLKSENVLINPEGEAKITDFGIARRLEAVPDSGLDETLTRAGQVVGTCRAMSPEQACGDRVDARSDLFSLGVLLYELFTGESPFRSETNAATVQRILNHRPPPARERATGLPTALSELIDHLLEKEPHLRPREAGEVAERLAAITRAVRGDDEATATLDAPVRTIPERPAAQSTKAIYTLMLTDLVDSTDLVNRLGDLKAMELSARHDHMARSLLARHGGREIDKSDGFLLLFERPIEAVHFALEYHSALAELSAEEGCELRARAGIHLGEVFLRENPPEEVRLGAKPLEVEGLAKATVARIGNLAEGGQTLMTRGAFDLAQRAALDDPDASELRWLNHGRYRLKGVEQPMEVYEVGVEGVAPLRPPEAADKAVPVTPDSGTYHRAGSRGWWAALAAAVAGVVVILSVSLWPPSAPTPPLYVAVLQPEVENKPPGEELERLKIAVRAALISGLANLEGISPKSQSEIDLVSGSPTAVARAVGADEVVTSRIACPTHECVVVVERVKSREGGVAWSSRDLPIPLDNPLIATRAIPFALGQGFPDHHPRADLIEPEVTLEDFSAYLDLVRIIETAPETPDLLARLRGIRERSKRFVDVYLLEAQLASRLWQQTNDADLLSRALDLTETAQRLTPADPEVLRQRLYIETISDRYQDAASTLESLERILPGDVRLLDSRAVLLGRQGKAAEALALYGRAIERQASWKRLYNHARLALQLGQIELARSSLENLLDRSEGNYIGLSLLAELELMNGDLHRAVALYVELVERYPLPIELSNLGTTYMLLGDYDGAVRSFERAVTGAPGNLAMVFSLAEALSLQGRADEARDLYRQVVGAEPAPLGTDYLAARLQALAHLGRHREAVKEALEALQAAPEDSQIAYAAAVVYATVGDDQSALLNVGRAIEHGFHPRWFELPWFERLRALPAFGELAGNASRDPIREAEGGGG